MLFRIEIVTTSHVTIERPSEKEAVEYAENLEREANSHHHHGEKTTAKAIYVPYTK